MKPPIVVTRPSLAPLEEYARRLESVWESGILTHHGPLVQELEARLREELGVADVACLANGTCALQLAIRALDLAGEIVTTPFSYVATPAIIAWERCRPVFADIDPNTWNLDPGELERHIGPDTVAILPVHVFGRPCDTERIEAIARRHGLPVIYDAAHAMSVEHGGRSLLSYGDVSCVSFHATKLFTTSEGGACISGDEELMARIKRMRFFGHDEGSNPREIGRSRGHGQDYRIVTAIFWYRATD
jgi:dTDP-4-amino-4,6-dideoxygalactose transaminase